MNLKPVMLFLLFMVARLVAEPVFQVHDGSGWKDIDAEAWGKLPRTELTAKAHDGSEHKYEGVAMSEVLKLLSAPSGQALRGAEMNRVVLFCGKDGYQVAFSLAELDASVRKQSALVADHMDGRELPDSHAPLMLVVPDDLKQARWVRQLARIVLAKVEPPKL